MNIRPLCFLAALIVAIAIPSGSAIAASKAAHVTLAQPQINGLVVKDTRSHASNRTPSTRPPAPRRDDATAHRSTRKPVGKSDRHQLMRSMALEDRTRQHEQAQVEARASRIYAVSQVSAPILRDTSACKRIGAHGESIYENCALVPSSHELR